MSEFTPITIESQEELDGMFKDRLNRQQAKLEKEYTEKLDGLNSEIETLKANATNEETSKQLAEALATIEANKTKAADFESAIKERDSKIASYESKINKTQAAIETGLPLDLAERLTGDTKEELIADAEKLLKSFGSVRTGAPSANTESASAPVDGVLAAFQKLNPNIKF